MEKKILLGIAFMSICLMTNCEILAVSTPMSLNNIVVTSNREFGIYGGMVGTNNIHLIYASIQQYKKDLIHFSVEEGKVKKNIIQEEFYLNNEICFSAFADQSFSVAYLATEENKSNQRYDHNYYYYYYNATTNFSRKIFLLNVNEYVYSNYYYNPELLGIRFLNNENVFLLTSISSESKATEVISLKIKGTTVNKQTFTLNGKITPVSSCYATTLNCAYFLFKNLTAEDDYLFIPFNFTTQTFMSPINISFSYLNYEINSGRLLFDQTTGKFFYFLPTSIGYSSEFALFEYNKTIHTFVLQGTTTNAYGIFGQCITNEIYYETAPKFFDVAMNGSEVSLLYLRNVPHIGPRLYRGCYNLTEDNPSWNFVDLGLDENYEPFYSSFSWNINTQEVIDSYLLGFIYGNASPYHSIGGGSKIISAISVLGPAASQIKKPFFIKAISIVYFRLIITASIITPSILIGSLTFYFLKKKRQRESN